MPRTHPEALLHEARRLASAGVKRAVIARRLGVSEGTVQRWCRAPAPEMTARRAKLEALAQRAALKQPLFQPTEERRHGRES